MFVGFDEHVFGGQLIWQFASFTDWSALSYAFDASESPLVTVSGQHKPSICCVHWSVPHVRQH